MKVLLLKDVAALGQRGDIKEVKPGYARNFLLARNLAKIATPGAEKEAEAFRKTREAEKSRGDAQFAGTLAALAGRTFTIGAKATARGNLYRAISKKQILSALEADGDAGITEEDIEAEPIKKLGAHTIQLKRADRTGSFIIEIVAKQ
ncbi:MAG: 50S ribosomal protein L9 [Candidatus Niyogibacteria bacterium]|nr:50S ribosomal protein L9 [Candidatus Niyogibacteria bacterium]